MFLLDSDLTIKANDAAMVKFLHLACFMGNLPYVKKVVEKGFDINARAARSDRRDYNRGTALHVAVLAGWEKVAVYLIEVGADVRKKVLFTNLSGKGFNTPIMAALKSRNWSRNTDKLATCEALVQRGASDDDGRALLSACAEDGDLAMTARLLELGFRVPVVPETDNIDVVQLLLDHGAHIEDVGAYQRFAIENGQIPLFEFLLQKFGPSLPEDQLGYIAFKILRGGRDWRTQDGHMNSLEYLVTKYWADPNTTFPMMPAIYDEKRKHINFLQRACDELHLEAIGLLLRLGADPDCPGLPETALAHMSGWKRNSSVGAREITAASLLLDAGSNIDGEKRIPEFGLGELTVKAPLRYAVESGRLEMVKFLVERGASVNLNRGEVSLLRLARDRGYSKVAEILIEGGAVDFN
jgi:ankyrin repeat protein